MTSEPTLYRKRCSHQPGTTGKVHNARCFVPVEACEHGNIDGHWADLTDHEIVMAAPFQSHEKWCPGAGIGGPDE